MRLSSPHINLIIKSCMKASRSLIRDFGELENLQVSLKGPNNFVTNSDRKVEKILIIRSSSFKIDRSLNSLKFQKSSGYKIKSWKRL